MKTETGSLQIIVKPTYRCNGACRYCLFPRLTPGPDMDLETVSLLFKRVAEYSGVTRISDFSLLWHGGEPLLMGDRFFSRVEELATELCPEARISHLFQTNLTLFASGEFPTVLRLVNDRGALSSSFDPFQGARRLKNGESYEETWLQACFSLKEVGVIPNVVYVVHPKSIGKAGEIYRYFANLGLPGLHINPVTNMDEFDPEGAVWSGLTPMDYGNFLVELWQAWSDDQYRLPVEPLVSWLKAYQDQGAISVCDLNGKCAYSLLCVGPQGDVFSCGRHMDFKLGRLGNLSENSLVEMEGAGNPDGRMNKLAEGHCRNCRWWQYCHGGCQLHAYAVNKRLDQPTPWCESYRYLFSRVFD